MLRIKIPVEKIGAVIGPGGKTIRSIIEETKATINVDNDGTVTIGSVSGEAAQKAVERIEMLTKEAEVGGIYTGKVVRLMNFGAFVEILPGKDGLVHISELSNERVESVEDVVHVGDEITVMVREIDSMGAYQPLKARPAAGGLARDGDLNAPAPQSPGRPRTVEGERTTALAGPGGRALPDRPQNTQGGRRPPFRQSR